MKSLAARRAERRRDREANEAAALTYGPDELNSRVNAEAGYSPEGAGADGTDENDEGGEGAGTDSTTTLADAGVPGGAAAGNGGLADAKAAKAADEAKAPGSKPAKGSWTPGA